MITLELTEEEAGNAVALFQLAIKASPTLQTGYVAVSLARKVQESMTPQEETTPTNVAPFSESEVADNNNDSPG